MRKHLQRCCPSVKPWTLVYVALHSAHIPACSGLAALRLRCHALQIGGFKAQHAWVTCLAWAISPQQTSPTSPPSQSPLPGLGSPQVSQLLLFSGSSDGCVGLHSQSVQHLGRAVLSSAPGGLLQPGLMQLRETLHDVDLLGVTCMSVKANAGEPATFCGDNALAWCLFCNVVMK